MKTCAKCGETKPLSEFHNDSRKRDGKVGVCKPCACAKATQSRQSRIEQVREYDRARQYLKPREKIKESSRKQYQKNKPYYRERVAARRAYMGCATPSWADKAQMVAMYEYAHWLRCIGVDAEVDHIVPLYGRGVCGLHVHCNLRVVLKEDNRRKNNRLDPTLQLTANPYARL